MNNWKKKFKKTRQTIEYRLVAGSLTLLACLPLRFLYCLSDIVCFFVHRVGKYRLCVVRKNLRNSFPEKTEEELRKIENDFYHYFCDCIVETIKLLHISDKQLKKRVRLVNPEVVYRAVDEKRPIILYLGHYGNWEWVPTMTLQLNRPEVMGTLYTPLHDKLMNRIMRKIRSRFNIVLIHRDKAYRKLMEMRRETPSFMIGFIADQRPMSSSIKHWTEFLNQDTAFVTGGETIGERIGASYVYVECERLTRGYYSLNFKEVKINEDDKEFPYTREFLRLLEETIRRAPAYWLWTHNRWRTKRKKS